MKELARKSLGGFVYRLGKLAEVKSIITLVCTGVFASLSLAGIISAEDFLQVFLIIVGFYFGTQAQKRADIRSDFDG